MATDAWPQVRNSVAEFWLRYQPPYSADRLAADLDGANATVARARQVKDRRAENAVAAEWEGRILALLILEPAAEGDLAAVIGRLQPEGARPSGSTGFHAGRAAGAGSARTPSGSIRVPIAVALLIVPIFLIFGVLGITRLIHERSSAPAVPQATGLGSTVPPPLPSSGPGPTGSAPTTPSPTTPSPRTTRGPWTVRGSGVVLTVESVTRQADPSQQGVEQLVVPIDVTSDSDLIEFDVTVLEQAGNNLYPVRSEPPNIWNSTPQAGINARSVLVFATDPPNFPKSLTMTFKDVFWTAGQRMRIDVPVPR